MWWVYMLVCLATGLLASALVLAWPRTGLVARWRDARQLAARSRREDALKHLLHSQANHRPVSVESLAGTLQLKTDDAADLLDDLEKRGLIQITGGAFELTTDGRELALHIVRAHRLWESFLADQTGVAESEWHARAERQEHLLTPEQTEALAARLGHPIHDPHGDVIPESGSPLPADAGQSLNNAPLNTPLLITHLEDEPARIYNQLAAMGLRPGMQISVTQRQPNQLRVRVEGQEQLLAPMQAENVGVESWRELPPTPPSKEQFLSALAPGQKANVLGLSPGCRGAERRRLLDLGFVPGTEVTIALISPSGDPVAYQIRGTTIALRREQARTVRISEPQSLAA